jgi:hypothetical protein
MSKVECLKVKGEKRQKISHAFSNFLLTQTVF